MCCTRRGFGGRCAVGPAFCRGRSSHVLTPLSFSCGSELQPSSLLLFRRCARAARFCAARLASHAACGLPQALYNRKREKRVLDLRLANEPTGLLVLLGPPSCGKTGAPSHLWRRGSLCFFLTRSR